MFCVEQSLMGVIMSIFNKLLVCVSFLLLVVTIARAQMSVQFAITSPYPAHCRQLFGKRVICVKDPLPTPFGQLPTPTPSPTPVPIVITSPVPMHCSSMGIRMLNCTKD